MHMCIELCYNVSFNIDHSFEISDKTQDNIITYRKKHILCII